MCPFRDDFRPAFARFGGGGGAMPPDVSPALTASGANRRWARAVDRSGVVMALRNPRTSASGLVSPVRAVGLVRTMVIGDRSVGERVDARRLIGAALITAGIAGIIVASAH